MSTFKEYLIESAKSYDYKIKIAGDIDKDFVLGKLIKDTFAYISKSKRGTIFNNLKEANEY